MREKIFPLSLSLMLLLPHILFSTSSQATEPLHKEKIVEDASATQKQGKLLPTTPAEEPDDKKFESNHVFAPLINSSPAFGTGLGGTAMFFFKPDPSDQSSPPSVIQPIFIYSNTDSHFGGLIGQFYFKEDTHRLTGFLGNAVINNDFELPTSSNALFSSSFTGLFGRYQYNIGGDYYLGMDAGAGKLSYKSQNATGDSYLSQVQAEDTEIALVGPNFSVDTRDNKMNPTKGYSSDSKIGFFPEALGNNDGYSVAETFLNHYTKGMNNNDVLASRAYTRFAFDAPYAGLSTIGKGADLRGYKAGETVSDNMTSFQSEYRMFFNERWTGVGFAGVGLLYSSVNELESENLYPSAGLGIRYAILPKERVNFRVDYARGKEGNDGLYISIREAF